MKVIEIPVQVRQSAYLYIFVQRTHFFKSSRLPMGTCGMGGPRAPYHRYLCGFYKDLWADRWDLWKPVVLRSEKY